MDNAWSVQSRQMPSPSPPAITPPQPPSAALGAALETAPAPKAFPVSVGFGNVWGPCPWRSRKCTNAQCHPNSGRVSDRFPPRHRFAFLDAVHQQHSHHPQPSHQRGNFKCVVEETKSAQKSLEFPQQGWEGHSPDRAIQPKPLLPRSPLLPLASPLIFEISASTRSSNRIRWPHC